MDDFSEVLRLYGIEKSPEPKEKMHKGAFLPKGQKVFHYFGLNQLGVIEIDTQKYYHLDYLNFIRLFEVLGFNEKTVDLTKSYLLQSRIVVIDFNTLQVAVKAAPKITSPVRADMTDAEYNYTEIIEATQRENPLDKNLKW